MKQNFKYFFLCSLILLFLFSCTSGTNTDPGKTNTTAPPTSTPEQPKVTTPSTTAPAIETTPPPVPIEEEENEFHSTIGDCIYIDFIGLAKITNISAAPEDGENCPDAMLVEFAFGPVNPQAVKRYKYTLFKDASQFMTISGGLNPSKDWVNRMGIEEGLVLTCKRQELFKGDCTEVLFTFEDLDMEPKTKCK